MIYWSANSRARLATTPGRTSPLSISPRRSCSRRRPLLITGRVGEGEPDAAAHDDAPAVAAAAAALADARAEAVRCDSQARGAGRASAARARPSRALRRVRASG